MIEFIDRVDSNNKKINEKTTKAESHKLGYSHRVAAIYVFNGKNELLVNQRLDNGLLDHSVGGHIRLNENPELATQREGTEEIGLSQNIQLKKLGSFYLDESIRGDLIFHWFYLYETQVKNFKPNIQKEEVKKVMWLPLSSIESEMRQNPQKFSLGFMGTMNYYLNKKINNYKKIILK